MNAALINGLMPLLFLLYQMTIDFVNLFPFNDLSARDKRLRKFEVLGNYPPLLIISFCFFYNSTVSIWIGFVMTAVIFAMHLLAWWMPYFFGLPKSVRSDYDRYFSKTYKFLPRIGDHPVPDAEHCGVGLLLVTTLLLQIMRLI